MNKLKALGLVVSVTAAATLLIAPAAFADGGHGDRNRGGDGDERVIVVNTGTPGVEDLDAEAVNEDRVQLQAVPAEPQMDVEVEQGVNDLNDDHE